MIVLIQPECGWTFQTRSDFQMISCELASDYGNVFQIRERSSKWTGQMFENQTFVRNEKTNRLIWLIHIGHASIFEHHLDLHMICFNQGFHCRTACLIDTNYMFFALLAGHESDFSIDLNVLFWNTYHSSPMGGKHTPPRKDIPAVASWSLGMENTICSSNPMGPENNSLVPNLFPDPNAMYRTSSCQSSHTVCPQLTIYTFYSKSLCQNGIFVWQKRVMITIWTILQWHASLSLHWLALSSLTWMNTFTINIYGGVLWQSALRS